MGGRLLGRFPLVRVLLGGVVWIWAACVPNSPRVVARPGGFGVTHTHKLTVRGDHESMRCAVRELELRGFEIVAWREAATRATAERTVGSTEREDRIYERVDLELDSGRLTIEAAFVRGDNNDLSRAPPAETVAAVNAIGRVCGTGLTQSGRT